LKVGEKLGNSEGSNGSNSNSNQLTITNSSSQPTQQPTKVYNFEVEREHTYYLDGEVWVHNVCNPLSGFTNTTNLKRNFVDHLAGEVSNSGAKGFHSMQSTVGRKVGNNYSEVTLANGDKAYKAIVQVRNSSGNWVNKVGNGGESSFFPDNWGYQKIIDEVQAAYQIVRDNRFVKVSGTINTFEATLPSGIKIQMYLEPLGGNRWGDIISAFPAIQN
jgi:hypothetical protein